MILCPPRSNRTDKLFPYPRLCRATRVLRHIILPHCVPGAVAGSIMVFMLAVGTYVVPAMLGGKGAIWFVQLIYSRFYDALNWNLGSAFAFSLLVLSLTFVVLMLRLFRLSVGRVLLA